MRKLRLRTIIGFILAQPSGRRQRWDLSPSADFESGVLSSTPDSRPSKVLNSFRLQELKPKEEPRDPVTWVPAVGEH